MGKADFLKDLIKKGKLEMVEPSEEIKESDIHKSESHLESASILLEKGKLEESVSMAYYSMYHMLTALLFRVGIKCENHTASIILLKRIFGIDNSFIFKIKDERVEKQYYVSFEIEEKDVRDLIKDAEEFNGKMLDFISRLNSERIGACRRNAEDFLRNIRNES